MVRRSPFLTQKIEFANHSCIIVHEKRENGDCWLHEFKIEKNRLIGLNQHDKWVATKGYGQWKRRLNLLFKPPENVTIFQSIRHNRRWITAKQYAAMSDSTREDGRWRVARTEPVNTGSK